MHGLPVLRGKAASLDAVGFQDTWLGTKRVHKHSKLQEQPVRIRPRAQSVHTAFKALPGVWTVV